MQLCSHLTAGNTVVVKRGIPLSDKDKKEAAYNSKGESRHYDLAQVWYIWHCRRQKPTGSENR